MSTMMMKSVLSRSNLVNLKATNGHPHRDHRYHTLILPSSVCRRLSAIKMSTQPDRLSLSYDPSIRSLLPVFISSMPLSLGPCRVPLQNRSYATAPTTTTATNDQVWENLNELNDFYDPKNDTDCPEEEDYANMSEEEYHRLLGQLQGDGRVLSGKYDLPNTPVDKMSRLKSQQDQVRSTLSQAIPLSSVDKIQTAANSLIQKASHQPSSIEKIHFGMKKTWQEQSSVADKFRIGTLKLPETLMIRLREIIQDYPRDWLIRDAVLLSQDLRRRSVKQVTGKRLRRVASQLPTKLDESKLVSHHSKLPILNYTSHQSMAYLVSQFHATFAANVRVLSEIKSRLPYFSPRNLLDFGAGCGAASWAAYTVWPSISRYLLVEPSASMNLISEKLLNGFSVQKRDFLHQGPLEKVDLILSSYVFGELLNDETRRLHARSLWEHLNQQGILVVLEPGTPIGFKIVRQVRKCLLELDHQQDQVESNQENEEKEGHCRFKPMIIGPCPHHASCPMSQTTWCHFTQRVQLDRPLQSIHASVSSQVAFTNPHVVHGHSLRAKKKQRQNKAWRSMLGLKMSKKNWDNVKFSYIAFSKGMSHSDHSGNYTKLSKSSRLVRQPLKRGGHVILDVCKPSGLLDRIIISKKHGKQIYKDARKSTWGDLFNLDPLATFVGDLTSSKRRIWKDLANRKKIARKTREEDIVDQFMPSQLHMTEIDNHI